MSTCAALENEFYEVKHGFFFPEQLGSLDQDSDICLCFDPIILLLRIYPKKMIKSVDKDSQARMFIKEKKNRENKLNCNNREIVKLWSIYKMLCRH